MRISQYYKQLFRDSGDESIKEYLSKNLGSAQWLIRCVSQREDTLPGCIKAIADIQCEYILGNSSVLIPMTLGDVAERMGVHKSTASRMIRSKFIQCNMGILPIKSFFIQKFGRKSSERDSADLARSMILKIVGSEDKRDPLQSRKYVGSWPKAAWIFPGEQQQNIERPSASLGLSYAGLPLEPYRDLNG